MNRRTLIAGNWKLNPPLEEGKRLHAAVSAGVKQRRLPENLEVVIFPPCPYLGLFGPAPGLRMGAQDVSTRTWGAYTGATGAPLLREFGVEFALVGHSERRHVFGESDGDCARKLRAARTAGLEPVLCVGETEPERDAGETFDVVRRQLDTALGDVALEGAITIAYEPVWAIGTGRTATPAMAAEVHRYLRNSLREIGGDGFAQRTPILYGGSVKPENAAALLADDDIDGALIGGASLAAESFLEILDSAVSVLVTR